MLIVFSIFFSLFFYNHQVTLLDSTTIQAHYMNWKHRTHLLTPRAVEDFIQQHTLTKRNYILLVKDWATQEFKTRQQLFKKDIDRAFI